MTELPYVRQPVDFSQPMRYAYGPDSVRHSDVPQGTIEEHQLPDCRAYPGAERRFWIYRPFQYDPSGEASLIVFQDGAYYMASEVGLQVPVVLDNLIHHGEMPVTIGLFIDPGEIPGAEQPRNRNHEYDAFDDVYVNFVLDEIVPVVRQLYSIVDDPDQWAIGGGSSGGNCALTAAWMRPDRFRRVLSFLGSFAQIPGGNPYPSLIRETPARPLRIFMQAATRDIGYNRAERNWLSENLQVAAALAEQNYDFRFVLGDGGHDANHAGAILPDALRWLWRSPS
ncbi:MAG TPA: alpha/beta hydrolase-fold protein [Acidimicrobiales bacterium]|nr:alpha/beta hydrolase-fold protein [Acidimicrobiales bacterium]